VTLDPERVLAEAAEWVWVPEDAPTVDTGDFLLIAYPPHFSDLTVATRWASDRPADELIDDVLDAAHELGREVVTFFDLSDTTRPADLERRLMERGAERTETLAVLALDLAEGVPDLDPPGDVELRPVATIDDLRASDQIDVEVFGGSLRADEALAASLDRVADGFRVLALRDGVPVGSAGHVVAGETLRLWGAAVLPPAQHTGVYRALLDHRLRAGVAASCRMALVKGRVDTSAPPLLRAGFQQYGEVRAYRLGQN
jgi:GNAT superfamily N-acetyltransferase